MNSMTCKGTILVYVHLMYCSWPSIKIGDVMPTRAVPPSRKSMRASGQVNRSGPHQLLTSSGSVHRAQTFSTGALKVRVTSTCLAMGSGVEEGCDVELAHLHKGGGDARGAGRVGHKLAQVGGYHLPGEAELVFAPPAHAFFAAIGDELVPVVVDRRLVLTGDDDGH